MAKAKQAPATVADRAWPADNVGRRKVADLVPYARNARTHSAAQVAKIAASIREFGFTTAVLLKPDLTIIAGHGRVLAAQKLGIETIPTMIADGWTDAQVRAYVLADNRLALDAGWDPDLLRSEIAGLQDDGFDIALTGFDDKEIEDLMGGAGDAGIEDGIDGEPPDNLAGSKFAVIVECRDEAHQEIVYNQLAGLGLKAKVVSV